MRSYFASFTPDLGADTLVTSVVKGSYTRIIFYQQMSLVSLRLNQGWKRQNVTANVSFICGPGCNHLKYDFTEKILKIHDFFGLNLQSIFSYHGKYIFFKTWPKTPFGGSKNRQKSEKNTFLSLFDFLSRKREMTYIFFISFFHSIYVRLTEKKN